MNTIIVNVTKDDFKGGAYCNPQKCALARALKRDGHKVGNEFGGGVGPFEATVNGIRYGILEHSEVYDCHDNPKDLTVHLLKL